MKKYPIHQANKKHDRTMADELSSISSMRDVFDYCTKHNLYSVAQGMIELPPPQKLRDIASALLSSGEDIHTYRNRFGVPEYRSSLSAFLKTMYGCTVPEEAILATAGVTGGIVSSLQLLRSRGKTRVALIQPFYTYHEKQVASVLGCSPAAYIASNDDFSPNFVEIERALKEGVDAIVMCNPGNPHGRCWLKTEMEQLTRLVHAYSALLIIDEIYCDMIFGDGKHYSPIEDKLDPQVIVCRGFSKTLAVQSWRIGYTVSHPDTVAQLMPLHDPIYICVSWVQHAVAKYLSEHPEDYKAHTDALNAMLAHNWNTLAPAFKEAMGWEVAFNPQGAMYGMLKHTEDSDMEAMQAALKKGVGVSPGNIFYGRNPENTGYIRIHVGMTAAHADQIASHLSKKES